MYRTPCTFCGKGILDGKELVHRATDLRICLTSLRRYIEGLVSTTIQGETIRSGRVASFSASYIPSAAREPPPEEGATAEIPGTSAPTPEQDSLEAMSLRACTTLAGGSIVCLEDGIAWPLDKRKSNSLDSILTSTCEYRYGLSCKMLRGRWHAEPGWSSQKGCKSKGLVGGIYSCMPYPAN